MGIRRRSVSDPPPPGCEPGWFFRCPCSVETFWALLSDNEFLNFLADEDKQIRTVISSEQHLDEQGHSLRDRTYKLTALVNPVPQSFRSWLGGDEFAFIIHETMWPDVVDRDHPRKLVTELPALGKRLNVTALQWAVPQGDDACLICFCLEVEVKIMGIGGTVRKGIIKDVKKNYAEVPNKVMKFLEKRRAATEAGAPSPGAALSPPPRTSTRKAHVPRLHWKKAQNKLLNDTFASALARVIKEEQKQAKLRERRRAKRAKSFDLSDLADTPPDSPNAQGLLAALPLRRIASARSPAHGWRGSGAQSEAATPTTPAPAPARAASAGAVLGEHSVASKEASAERGDRVSFASAREEVSNRSKASPTPPLAEHSGVSEETSAERGEVSFATAREEVSNRSKASEEDSFNTARENSIHEDSEQVRGHDGEAPVPVDVVVERKGGGCFGCC